ncbi:MAG TPA: DUF485 domain-containing protein [Bacilli bacterium]|nr:DUF485 domain-containing protein [Bacilli bacterium]
MGNAPQSKQSSNIDYEKIVSSSEFKNLVKSKNKFMAPFVIFFFLAYFTMPVLTGFTEVLEAKVIGWVTGTWVYAFGMFIMVWTFSTIYMSRSSKFDADAEEIINKNILN